MFTDITNYVELDDMPLCPLCDSVLEQGPVVVVTGYGCMALAHSECVASMTEDDE